MVESHKEVSKGEEREREKEMRRGGGREELMGEVKERAGERLRPSDRL